MEKYKKEIKSTQPVVINLSRDDLTNYVGTTTETLVRILRHLKDEQIITASLRKITILKPKDLEKIADFYEASFTALLSLSLKHGNFNCHHFYNRLPRYRF